MSQLRLVKFFSLLFGTATLLFSPTSSQNPGIAVRINEQGLHAGRYELVQRQKHKKILEIYQKLDKFSHANETENQI